MDDNKWCPGGRYTRACPGEGGGGGGGKDTQEACPGGCLHTCPGGEIFIISLSLGLFKCLSWGER